MSLQTLQATLQQLSGQGALNFGSMTKEVAALGAVLEQLPPIGIFPFKDAQLELSGSGDSQALTVTSTLDWQLLTGTTVTVVVTVDPTAADRYLVTLTLQAPDSAKLSIPGVTWFALGKFQIGGQSVPSDLASSTLSPSAFVTIGTTLLIQGDSSQTPLPIVIQYDPTGELILTLNTSAIDLPSINDILAAFGGASSAIKLPDTINQIAHFSLLDLSLGFRPSDGGVTMIALDIGNSAKAPGGWPIIPNVLSLVSYEIGLHIADPLNTRQVSGLVSAKALLGSVDITVSAVHPASGGWQFQGFIAEDNPVPIGDIIDGLGKQFGVSMPGGLHQFTLKQFEFTFDTAAHNAAGNFTVHFVVNGTQIDLTVNAALTNNNGTYTKQVGGKMTIGTSEFDVSFVDSPTDKTFTASWSDLHNPLEFKDIAARFGFTNLPEIPKSLDLGLVQASFTYDFSQSTLVLTAQSSNPNYGSSVFVARNAADGWQFFFSVKTSAVINLTNLPLINSVLPDNETVAIEDIQVVIASALLNGDAAKAINGLIKGAQYPTVPPDGLPAGVGLSMVFQAGSFKDTLSISTGGGGNGQSGGGNAQGGTALQAATNGDAAPAADPTVPATKSSDGTMWYSLQKQFGPVTFQKVGIRWQSGEDGKDGILFVLMNAALDAGGLTISVLGLGVGSPLTTFSPTFNIDGLAITLQEGPVEVSGGMVGTIDPVNFYGELILGFTELTISALGGYAQYQGHPSFFLYAVVDYPIGGPPFFFVTGLAAGMGFNRKLVIPDITGVATFPLVQWATGSASQGMDPGGDIGAQVTQVVSTLSSSGVVAPSIGDYWLAVGIKFTSFEILQSFALLTVTFGTRFEIDLLGLSVLSMPPAVDPPIARVELALKASFSPSDGLLAIQAQLTPNSYVLDQACHLTGGFAFFSWFAGEHEGDFVVTLGGYNPSFTVPSHYPQVPRLGLNWQVIPSLTIQGDMYFALTSNAVMAGGELSAMWEEGPISAWFTVWADFLMIFKPFHYMISAGIDLGAAFTIKVWFIHIRITIHIGVSLQIWGPPFAGVATVDLSIISFSISFGGGGPAQDTTIEWPDFVKQLLPSAPPPKPAQSVAPRFQRVMAVAAPLGDTNTDPPKQPAVVQISVTQGLLKTLDTTAAHPWYLVNGETFQCQITTAMPFKTTSYIGPVSLAPVGEQPVDDQGNPIQPNTTFSAGPAGIPPDKFNPNLELNVDTAEDSQFLAVMLFRNAAKALWHTQNFANGVPVLDPSTALTDSTLPNTLHGYWLLPFVVKPDQVLAIPLPILEFTLDDNIRPFAWSTATYPTHDIFTNETVAETITSLHASASRTLLLSALAAQNITIDSSVDVDSLKVPANNDLMAAPWLSLLGEQGTSVRRSNTP